jgi:hypothetical protein
MRLVKTLAIFLLVLPVAACDPSIRADIHITAPLEQYTGVTNRVLDVLASRNYIPFPLLTESADPPKETHRAYRVATATDDGVGLYMATDASQAIYLAFMKRGISRFSGPDVLEYRALVDALARELGRYCVAADTLTEHGEVLRLGEKARK